MAQLEKSLGAADDGLLAMVLSGWMAVVESERVQVLEEEIPFDNFMVAHFDKVITYDIHKFLNRATCPWFHARLLRSSRMSLLWSQSSQYEECLNSMD